MAVCSDSGDGFKVEVVGFVLSTSGKKEGGRDTPWSSRWDGVHVERAQSGRHSLRGDGVHVVRTGGKVVAGRVQTSVRRENFIVSRLSRWRQTQSPLLEATGLSCRLDWRQHVRSSGLGQLSLGFGL